jgi:Putative peptidoglycan binding domain/D-alanyl-D-alanine carboxypeptidase
MSPSTLTIRGPLPSNMNPGLSPATQATMLGLLGNPRDTFSHACQPVTNKLLKSLIVVDDVGPFRIQGLRPAIESLKEVMAAIREQEPDVFQVIGTAGMSCARLVTGSEVSISNHSWGTAIDITIDGVLDVRGNRKAQKGLRLIAPLFNVHGWFWGAAFPTEDSMHFEVSDETIRQWQREGKFNNTTASPLPEHILSLGDRGPKVSELQTLLNKSGAQLAVDGIFGRATLAAVMAFQGAKGLTVDGVVGKLTLAALRA